MFISKHAMENCNIIVRRHFYELLTQLIVSSDRIDQESMTIRVFSIDSSEWDANFW